MAYVNPYPLTTPDGSEDAELIDDIVLADKTGLVERLEDTIYVDCSADPWVVQPSVLGNSSGKFFPMGPYDIKSNIVDLIYGDGFVQLPGSTGTFFLPIRLPPFTTFTTTVSGTSVLNTLTLSPTLAIDTGSYNFVKLAAATGGTHKFWGARLKYSTPNCLRTF